MNSAITSVARSAVLAFLILSTARVAAHRGGLNECGCHINRKTGECHCHRNYRCGCECQPASCELGSDTTAAPGAGRSTATEADPQAAACGVERWLVKIVADPNADKVGIDSPQRSTIEQLRAMIAPVRVDVNLRSPPEEQVLTVEGWLSGYKFEANDSDFHVVIKDDAGKTIIVEFPHPDCMLGSRVLKQATEARAKFRELVRPPSTTRYILVREQIRVRVTGVAFFDEVHGQIGVAPNGVELHPVLAIERLR